MDEMVIAEIAMIGLAVVCARIVIWLIFEHHKSIELFMANTISGVKPKPISILRSRKRAQDE
jgi:hypothetical protein